MTEQNKKQKIFIIPMTENNGFGRLYAAISESYEILAKHFCSHDGFAVQDLGTKSRVHLYQRLHDDGLEPEFEFFSDSDERFNGLLTKVMQRALRSREEKEND